MLEQRCAATVCHGVAPGAVERGEQLTDDVFHVPVDDQGRVTDWRAARRSALHFVDAQEAPMFSSLLRKPLAPVWGGVPHRGGANITSPDDPAWDTIARWIASESEGGEDPEPAQLDADERFFAEEVQPRLVGRSCALANCHGPESFVPMRLDPGIATESGEVRFSIGMTRANYETLRPFLALDGDPAQSRLLRKAMPLEHGGITHRGGNRSFVSPDDEAHAAIVEWARRERAAEVGDAPTSPTSFVYVRGPTPTGSVFDIDRFQPGSELMLWRGAGPDGEAVSLTSQLFARAVDVRDPSVSPDGTRVLFAVRRARTTGHAIWELELESGAARQITHPPPLPEGLPSSDVSPLYGPDGWIWFASNRHGVMAERLDALDVDLYRVHPDGDRPPERMTFTPAPEIAPSVFRVGPLHDYLVFSYRRAIDSRDRTVGFSFPVDLHVDYHIFFGITPRARLFWQFREMPDGRALTIVGDPDNVVPGGQIALVDRNLGPDRRAGMDGASLPAYADTLRVLDPDTAPTGESGNGFYRDPVALPDGSVLAAWAPGPVDLSDPELLDAAPRLRIVHLAIDEAPEGCVDVTCMPTIGEREVWIDDASASVHSVRPVVVRPGGADPDDFERAIDRGDPTLFSMVDIAVNDGVMNNLFPHGPKTFRDDVRYVRLVEAVPRRPGEWAAVGELLESGAEGASTTTLGPHMPSRILGEVELYDDNSLYVQVPAGVPFRTQLLDADRMNVGHQHNRWLFVWSGQHFSQSTSRHLYDQRCGGCHGSESGEPVDVLDVPDATSRATVTLARFVNRNPRRPRDPVVLGESTREEITFVDDVQPILDARCGGSDCHGPAQPAGGLQLTSPSPTTFYDTAYEALLAAGEGSGGGRAYVAAPRATARASHLIEIATGRELAAPRTLAHPDVELDAASLDTLIRWIELGAPYRLGRESEPSGEGAP